MLLLIFLLTIFVGFFKQNNKNFWLWCTLLLVIIINTSVNYADYNNYENYFNLVNNGIVSKNYLGMPDGWYYLCMLFHTIGFSYRGMSAIILFISCLLIHKSIYKLTNKENIFWSFFIIFPGLINCVQLRFFFGLSIVFYGFMKLLNQEKHSFFLFLILILISFSIHSSCIGYVIFLLLPLFDKIGVKKIMGIAITLSFAVYLFLDKIISFLSLFLPQEKIERYLLSSASSTSLSWILKIALIWIIGMIFVKYFSSIINKYDSKKTYKSFITNCENSFILLLLVFPLLTIDENFHRFIELGYMVLIFLLSIFLDKCPLNNKERISYIAAVLISFIFAGYIYTPFPTVIEPFFKFSGFHTLFK